MNQSVSTLYVYSLLLAVAVLFAIAPGQAASLAKDGEEAIRIRVIAADNSTAAQETKREVVQAVGALIQQWQIEKQVPAEVRRLIQEQLPLIQQTAADAAQSKVNVTFGQAPFPVKTDGRYVYPPANYEALVITIEEGNGSNWWCMLYPSFCFENPEHPEKEVTWLLEEVWEKYQDTAQKQRSYAQNSESYPQPVDNSVDKSEQSRKKE